jgi:uncharacterized protein (DUF58 family)
MSLVAPPRPIRSTVLIGRLLRAWEERLTARGRYVVWAAAIFALTGVDTRRSQLYVLFAMAAGALLVALVIAGLRRPRVLLECALPARVTAVAPVPIRVRMSATGRTPDLRLFVPRPLRWGASLEFRPREIFVDLPGGEAVEGTFEMRALRRGRYVLRGPTLRATDPLHLFALRGVALPDQALLVYPRFFGMAEFPIPLGRRYQPGGIPLSSSTGDAIEFVGTRDYREGDPIRNIHFRSWARRGEPVVKEYQEEYFCRIAVILDTFLPRKATTAEVDGFEAGISVLASVADYFSRSEYIVDILAAGPDIYEVSAGRSLAYLENILDVLACLEPCHDAPFSTIGPALFEKLAQITTVVAVLLDWDEPRRDFLRRIRALGTAVRAVVVRQGTTTETWLGAEEEIGQIEQMTPGEVNRAIEAYGPAGRSPVLRAAARG